MSSRAIEADIIAAGRHVRPIATADRKNALTLGPYKTVMAPFIAQNAECFGRTRK